MDVVETRHCLELKMLIKNQEKVFDYRQSGDKFGVCASTASKKVNTAGTDESLFRLVPVYYLWS